MPLPRTFIAVCLLMLPLTGCQSTPRAGASSSTTTVSVDECIAELLSAGRFGEELWRMNLTRVAQEQTTDECIQVSAGLTLVQDQYDVVHAINTESGTHRWVVAGPGPLTAPANFGGLGITMLSDDTAVVVHALSGARLSHTKKIDLDFWPSAVGADSSGVLMFGSQAPYGVQAVDPSNGQSGWRYPTRAPVVALYAQGGATGGQVVGVTEDGLLFSLPPWPAYGKAPTEENWYRRLPGARVSCPVSRHGDTLYVGASDSFLYSIDARNGRVNWKNGGEGPITGMAIVGGDAVYARSQSGFHAFAASNGELLWTCPDSKRLITRIDDRCYVEMNDGSVTVRQAEDGNVLASFSIDHLAHVPSVQGGGIFVAGDGTGNLMALR